MLNEMQIIRERNQSEQLLYNRIYNTLLDVSELCKVNMVQMEQNPEELVSAYGYLLRAQEMIEKSVAHADQLRVHINTLNHVVDAGRRPL